jgi:hypothetical protein
VEIGSPVAAMSTENTVRVKKTGVAFSVRAKNCADPAAARFSGTAVWMKGANRESTTLQLIPGTTPGTYVVGTPDRMTEGWWIAVVTAACAGAKAGALVPVSASGQYDRASASIVSHAATDAEVESMMKQMKGASQ